MKRLFLLMGIALVLSLCTANYTNAQTPAAKPVAANNKAIAPEKKHNFQEILQLKRNYIKENLSLPEKKAEKFWAIYDKYIENEQALHANLKKAYDSKKITREMLKDESKMTDDQISFHLSQKMNFKEKMFNLDKRFYNDAKSVLTPRELSKFYHLEQSFKNQCAHKNHDGRNHDAKRPMDAKKATMKKVPATKSK